MHHRSRLLAMLGLSIACSGPLAVRRDQPRGAEAAAQRRPSPTPVPAGDQRERVADARHLLGRLAFGPRPGDIERAVELGPEGWLRWQLEPPAENPALEAALAPHRSALAPPVELVDSWLGEHWGDDAGSLNEMRQELKPHYKEHLAHLASAELVRHILSERQVQEVMVDFWANHFNVFAKKGFVRLFAGDYLERALRPHALGRFSDLLLETARHPAMLLYLDNADSVAPGMSDKNPGKQKARGLNENYARELLELHTLGVDGGYTQDDVIGVARILTGYSVVRKGGKLEYVFHKNKHDKQEKVVLGQHFAAGGGEEEGVRLLALLANHPATAKHLAFKLCARFVRDDPPAACVENAAREFLASGGEIKAVLRAIVQHESFWDAGARSAKLKSPLEFLVSAARALGARPDASADLSEVLEKLGEPLLEERVPTGYPDSEPDWTSSGGLLGRMNFATRLGTESLPGLTLDFDAVLPRSADSSKLVRRASALLFAGQPEPDTVRIVEHELLSVEDFEQRRALAVALLIGSPEFQRQ